MSTDLRIGTLFPKHLNLNGDQANLIALQVRAREYGVQAKIEPIFDLSLSEYDLVFLGHGSLAAWQDITFKKPDLLSTLAHIVGSDKFVLAVGSGYVHLAGELGLGIQQTEHRSEFVNYEGIVGYLNSGMDLQPIMRYKKSILTLLHGPLLVKNPHLADEILEKIGVPVSDDKSDYLKELDLLAEQSRGIAFDH